MIKTLVGKMDGDRMVPIKKGHQMNMTGPPLQGDIVEMLGRVYVCDGTWEPPRESLLEVRYRDVTHAFRLLEGGET